MTQISRLRNTSIYKTNFTPGESLRNTPGVAGWILFFTGIFSIHILFYLFIKTHLPLVQDEYFHFDQISRYLQNIFVYNGVLMTPPGYHFIVFFFAKILDAHSLSSVKSIAFILNLSSIPLVYFILRKIDRENARIKTLQYAFLPIFSVFFPLMYTDIVSLTFVLLALFCVYEKRYWIAGFVATASLFIRQNNIIYLPLINIIQYYHVYGWRWSKENMYHHAQKSLMFIVGVVAILVFILVNKGLLISPSAKSYMHFNLSNLNNIYLYLFVSFFYFFPAKKDAYISVWKLVTKKKWIAGLILAGCIWSIATFTNDHPFNQAPWFLHNAVMMLFSSTILWKTLFFIIVYSSLLLHLSGKYLRPYRFLLLPFAFLYLLPYLMVEIRYSFVPVILYLLVRKIESKRVEYIRTILFAAVSSFVVFGVANYWFFP